MNVSRLLIQLQQADISKIFIYIPTLLSSFYIFCKGLNIKLTLNKAIYVFVSSFVISFILFLTELNCSSYTRPLTFILPSLAFIILSRELSVFITLPTSIVAVGIVYCFRLISHLPCGIINLFIKIDSHHIIWGITIAFMQMLFSILFMNIKRFKNGFSFFREKENFGIGLILSAGVLFIISIINKEYVSISILPIIVVTIPILLSGIFMWIKRGINQKYLNNLQKRELLKYKTELAEKQEQIDNLLNSNTALAKIVHRDNHLISALNYTIKQQLNKKSTIEQTEQLLTEIITMLKERSDLVLEEQLTNKLLPTTDISMIDGAIGNMLVSCVSHKIDFDVVIHCKPTYIVNSIISQTNLETLLCDHIKDAIISVSSYRTENGKILLAFNMENGVYEITIKDNGCDFTIDTLSKLGIQSVTTHKDTGGTGMGFMTTFKTLKSCKASLIITEYKSHTPFSKAITFKFDGHNSFIINSYRGKELSEQINRTDIVINNINI